TACSADLLSYQIEVTSDADVLNSTEGTVTNNGGGSFTVSGITAGTDVTLTAENTTTGCQQNLPVTAPDCSCPSVAAPTSGGDQTICADETIPALTVTVGADETADWYDAAIGGTLLLTGNTSFTPTAAGTYYAETRNTTTDCISATRIAVTLTINVLPTLVVNSTACSADLLSYQIDVTTDGNMLNSTEG
ncbi:MAG: hypothetical protein GY732_16070, partial [Gammaproteobacteria bacterium]|nr:hypothetical protein [Gammaproteobacteria bacterium]